MADRSFLRWGAGAAMVGAVLALVFNVLHPRTSDVANVENELELVAGSSIWLFDHFMLAWAIAFAFVGYVAISRSFPEGPGAWWGRLAMATVIAGATVGFVTVLVDGMAMKHVADAWVDASGASRATLFATAQAVAEIGVALFTGTIGTLFGLTPFFFGVAILNSNVYPRWLAWLALLSGALGLFTASLQYLAGISVASALVLFPIASISSTFFLFLAGGILWKRTAIAAPVAASKSETEAA